MDPEIEVLQGQIQELKRRLSEARRAVEPEPVNDYALTAADGRPVTLRELFGGRRDLLVIHNMGTKCVYCTLWADGLNGMKRIIEDRCAIVLTSPDPAPVMRAFAASRGWTMACASHAGTSFARDLGFEPQAGKHWPGVSGLRLLSDGTIARTGSAPFGPGDDFCPVWPLFDLLHKGADGWEPKYAYPDLTMLQ